MKQEKGSVNTAGGISSPMANEVPESTGSGSRSVGASQVSSPFKDRPFPTAGLKDDAKDTYDRNRTPVLSKPRDMGKDSIPTVFYEDVPGAGEGHDPHITSPFKDDIKRS